MWRHLWRILTSYLEQFFIDLILKLLEIVSDNRFIPGLHGPRNLKGQIYPEAVKRRPNLQKWKKGQMAKQFYFWHTVSKSPDGNPGLSPITTELLGNEATSVLCLLFWLLPFIKKRVLCKNNIVCWLNFNSLA